MDPLPDLAGLAREAYGQGWALSGGPMTDRVKAGCVAAVDLALAYPDHPGVLEATLHLGHMEGTWAAVYQRREEVETRNAKAIRKAWRTLAGKLDLDRLVRAVRRRAGLSTGPAEAEFDDVTDQELAAIVRAALMNLDRNDAEWTAIRHAFADAVRSGRAEGRAEALALAADMHARVGFDFDLAFEEAYAALEHIHELVTDADGWLDRFLGDEASDFGRLLGGMARDGASWEDMRDSAADLLDDPDARALRIAIDQVTGRALSKGALDLYASEGVSLYDFLTAGDTRVDSLCEDAESNGPYRVGEGPVPPLHPFCRCAVAAREPLPIDLLSRYLPTEG
jgi:hypothetical protein